MPSNDNADFVAELRETICTVSAYIDLPANQPLRSASPDQFLAHVRTKFPSFTEKYPYMVSLLVKGGDRSMLELFVSKLQGIDEGSESLDEVRGQLAQLLHDRFVGDVRR